jgi:pyrimidine operon attenuation protein/uracil phosphoribosyltransferase
VLVGLHTRGVPLAKRLADGIEKYERSKLNVGRWTSPSNGTT